MNIRRCRLHLGIIAVFDNYDSIAFSCPLASYLFNGKSLEIFLRKQFGIACRSVRGFVIDAVLVLLHTCILGRKTAGAYGKGCKGKRNECSEYLMHSLS